MKQNLWSGVGQAMASFMFIWAMARQFMPRGLDSYVLKYADKLWSLVYPYVRVTFNEYSSDGFKRSEAYSAIRTYLSATTSKAAKRLTADIGKDSSNLVLSLDDNEQVTDEFKGIKAWWTSRKIVSRGNTINWYPAQDDRKYYRLTFHRAHRAAMEDYIKHVIEEGKAIQVKNRQRKLFTNSSGDGGYRYKNSPWSHVVFEHPATFDKVAMDPDKKAAIVQDLDSFRNGKDFYNRIGKAWKRGYLLFGPPGTGKSTMIAAMANHMDYDVYDLELTAVTDNTELRKLLIGTTSKSIIVIEDIDCSEDLSGKRKKEEKTEEKSKKQPPGPKKEEDKASKVTLSGLLNFIDGLWSSCGGERLIVFTTNHIEKLDPALIRRGRMDLHIEMSYCCFDAFKILAKNYLLLEDHPLFEKVKELIEVEGVKMTPADVAENLMPKITLRDVQEESTRKCLESLIEAMRKAKEEAVIEARRKAEEEAVVQAEEGKLDQAKEEKIGGIEEEKAEKIVKEDED